MAAMDDLEALLSTLPGYSSLTTGMKQKALDGALIPDSDGVWPGQDGYVSTYDVYYAAYSLIGFLSAQPVVTSTSSEGTSVTVHPPNWTDIKTYFSGLSVILGYKPILGSIPIPYGPHIRRVDMRGEGSYGSGIDTDLG